MGQEKFGESSGEGGGKGMRGEREEMLGVEEKEMPSIETGSEEKSFET